VLSWKLTEQGCLLKRAGTNGHNGNGIIGSGRKGSANGHAVRKVKA
jgi:hypothetical protein